MANLTSTQLKRLATRPHEYARFVLSGRAPQGVKPSSPLIALLHALSPHDRTRLMGVRVDSRLGYTGSRQFHNGAQALNWIEPSDEVFGSFPADSWRDKRFTQQLYLEDLLDCCASAPSDLAQRYPRLRRPAPRVASSE